MTIKVYDINTEAEQREITKEEYIENINELFEMINEQVPVHQVLYSLSDEGMEDEDNPISVINENYFREDEVNPDEMNRISEKIAGNLLEAELITEKDGTKRRNLNITQGILIIKYENDFVSLLKFEEASNVNPNTFAVVKTFSLNNQYYKYARIKKVDLQEVQIVDRGNKVAKYWAEIFLGLTPKRTSESNTKEVINLLENQKLFNEEIEWQDNELEILKQNLLEYLYGNQSFTKENFINTLDFDIDRDDINIENIFSDSANETLDAEFDISRKELNKKYKLILPISDTIELVVDNLNLEKRKESFELDQNKLIIKVSNNRLEELTQLLGDD